MVTFVGKSFDTVDDLLSGGSAAALGSLAKQNVNGHRVAPETVIDELRRLAVEQPGLFEHAFELGRMAGEINCVWRRVEARLDDNDPSGSDPSGRAPGAGPRGTGPRGTGPRD